MGSNVLKVELQGNTFYWCTFVGAIRQYWIYLPVSHIPPPPQPGGQSVTLIYGEATILRSVFSKTIESLPESLPDDRAARLLGMVSIRYLLSLFADLCRIKAKWRKFKSAEQTLCSITYLSKTSTASTHIFQVALYFPPWPVACFSWARVSAICNP